MKTIYDTMFKEACGEYLPITDWRLLKAQGYQESRLDPNAVSPAGAVGIMQFMPNTWDEQIKKSDYENEERTDPEASIYTGACYMRWLYDEWSSPRPEMDRYCLALASYNAGIGNILEAQRCSGNSFSYSGIMKFLPEVTGEHSRETIWYVKHILKFYTEMVTG